ncbi:CHAT domain-containing protein [Mycena latifolia]|nr:CHAT domain-containing protein [Mycena latifolia]
MLSIQLQRKLRQEEVEWCTCRYKVPAWIGNDGQPVIRTLILTAVKTLYGPCDDWPALVSSAFAPLLFTTPLNQYFFRNKENSELEAGTPDMKTKNYDSVRQGIRQFAHKTLAKSKMFKMKHGDSGNGKDQEAALQHNQGPVDTTREGHLEVSDTDQDQRSDDLKELEAALQQHQVAVDLTAEGHPERAEHLNNLGVSYRYRYWRLGDLKDMEAALKHKQEAVDLTPEDHVDRAGCLRSLAVSYTDRYWRLGDLKDLETALQHYQETVNLTPEGHPTRARCVLNLAIGYSERYLRLGDLQDLEAALQHNQQAVDLTPDGHPNRAENLHSLAISYNDRYERLGDLKDLEVAFQHNQEAVDLTPEGHPDRSVYLRNFAINYANRYSRLGDLKDLEASLQHNQEALDLTPNSHPSRARRLRSLGVSYIERYQRLGNVADLEAALQYSQKAVDLTPEGHPNRADHLRSLAVSYADHYRQWGDLKYLEAALQHNQEAVNVTPDGHPRKAGHLQGLAGSYEDRYQRLGDLKDLEAVLQHKQEAIHLTPEGHPSRARCLKSLAVSYAVRYQRLGDAKDLEAALQYSQKAVDLTPEGHPDKVGCLKSLAYSHMQLYWMLSNLEDLEAALQHNQKAVDLIPDGYPSRAEHLRDLGVSYSTRYERLGDINDLEAALKHKQEAVDLTPEGHPSRARRLGGLKDLDAALQHTQEAVDLTPQGHPERAQCLQTLAICYADRGIWENILRWASYAPQIHPKHCISAFRAAFQLLPELLWMGHSISARVNAVQRLNLPQATSDAVRTLTNLQELTFAVEIMEQGLGTIYQQMLQLKTAVDDLPPHQAEQFKHLSMQLYMGGSDPSMTLVNKRNDLIKEIRQQPYFESFLLPKPYTVLCKASQGGPVIILNSHTKGCVGIIILNPTSDPVPVAFPDVMLDLLALQRTRLEKLNGHRARNRSASTRLFGQQEGWLSTREEFENMLAWLWSCIAGPVYQVLELHGIHNGRLWWLPTGAFTGLPLHACPPNDRFVHSYTATLGSLLEVYSKKTSGNAVKVGVVGVTHTGPGSASFLPGVGQEVRNICSAIPKSHVKCLEDQQATVDAVKKSLQECSWVHLACHGRQNLIEPIKSHLLLYGGNLELETILKMPLSNAEVVFLAACQTATCDINLVNQSFHLGGGFIAAGFRGAIGTLWAMDDRDGPRVAKLFYSHLFRDGRQPQASDAAEALHLAVQELKRGNVPYERWIPFIHMGV